jgi:16S rRNA (uracil1498-N3)-methyltransferase
VTPRFHCALALAANRSISLPPGAARHVQVLRMQPGAALTLFDGRGGEYAATVERMGRSEVEVRVGGHAAVEREAARAVHLAVGMPANERMDWLVEKATELGAASIQPLMTAHAVLRLTGERAEKKRAHWEAIAVAACEQCGRNRMPDIRPAQSFADWMASIADVGDGGPRFVLSLAETARPAREAAQRRFDGAWVLSGPEGGLSAGEETQAIAHGFMPLSLGPRVLRAETAALAALALLS